MPFGKVHSESLRLYGTFLCLAVALAAAVSAQSTGRANIPYSDVRPILDTLRADLIPAELRALAPAAIALGEAEGLDAHARSVAMRLNPR